MKKIEYVNYSMNEKKHISENLRLLEDKIKRMEEESEFRSWKIQGKKIVIENKKSLLKQRNRESAAIRGEILQKEQELKKASSLTQTEHAYKSPDISFLKNNILCLKSKLQAIDKVYEKLSEEIEYYKKKLSELTNNADDEILYHYKRLSGSKEGNPIAQVTGKVCGGCYMSVTTQNLNTLKYGNKLELCPNCKRILFLREDDRIRNG